MRWRSRTAKVVGYVDHVGDGLIRGWAADLHDRHARLALDVVHNGVFLGCARAGGLREDLRAQDIGDGRYGFVFHDPAFANPQAAAGLRLIASDRPRTDLAIAVACTSKEAAVVPASPAITHIRDLLLPLVASLASESSAASRLAMPQGGPIARRLDTLFADRSGTSAFVAHVGEKYCRPSATDDPDAFWRWYLEVYGVEQAARPAVSAEDIARLSCMAWTKCLRETARGRRSRIVHAFAWAIHESRRLRVEDCLVGKCEAARLAAIPWMTRRGDFPLSHFMRMLRRSHGLLRSMPVLTASDRIGFYAAVMLLALRELHYLRYMPSAWVDRMLSNASGRSLFEDAQRRLADGLFSPLSCEGYRARIAAGGFDLPSRRFTTRGSDGHRLAMPVVSPAEPAVDVQMIGPFGQSLGLAESCRRVARALLASGLDVNFVDYRVGVASRPAAADVPIARPRRARINILHLNAEEVPEAMASCPAALSGGHTILMPYWELNRPSSVHRLGLALVDEVWCASRFLAMVFARAAPVVHVGMCHDDRAVPPARAATAAFTVLTVSDALSWARRKNVLGAIDAFQAAFADADARLVVKTRNVAAALGGVEADAWLEIASRCDDDPRITLLDAELPPTEQRALLAGADCLLSLHRAEGLGLDILDAMQLGTPVVATAYSGNMDLCCEATAWPVGFDPVPVAPGHYAFVEPGHLWAEPKLASAVAALRRVRGDLADRRRRTTAAREQVQVHASPDAFSARLSRRLKALLARLPS